MVKRRVRAWAESLRRLITEPRSELSRWQLTMRFMYLLGLEGARRLRQGRAQEMAAALSFRTLFGLLPVLVVGTLLVRAVQGWDVFYATVAQFIDGLGLGSLQVFTEDGGRSITLGQWLLELLTEVETISLAAIGWIGLLVLVYSAMGLMLTIENSFNAVYRAPRGRSWTQRLPSYWFVLCLAPAAVALTTYADRRVASWIQDVGTWDWVLAAAGWMWALAVAWLILFAVYKVVPHTNVGSRPAMAGAFVAALLLLVGKVSLGAYLENALSLRQLYGSLGLIPLFMFWVYLMWLVVLYGLEVAALLQTVRGGDLEDAGRIAEFADRKWVDPAAIVSVMEFVAEGFEVGRSIRSREIGDALGLPQRLVERMLDRLARAGLLHRLDGDGAVSLALPPERIETGRLMELGFELVDEGQTLRDNPFVRRIRDAQRDVASSVTLASLVSRPVSSDGQAVGP